MPRRGRDRRLSQGTRLSAAPGRLRLLRPRPRWSAKVGATPPSTAPIPRWRLKRPDEAETPLTIEADVRSTENVPGHARDWRQTARHLAGALAPLAFLLLCLLATGFRF